ncbi:MAG TPA: glucokinase [Gammaproteobacteria bacterium]|nr:glucokinase [Gammaproteobacteria bacterium]
MKVIAGDIGGTKTSLALFDVSGTKPDMLVMETWPSQDYASLDDIIKLFISTRPGTYEYACFGVAGPVRNGISQTTNLPWHIDAQKLAQTAGVRRAWLLNDLEANAWGINALDDEDFCILNEGQPDAYGNACVIAAGTGLGQAGITMDGQHLRPFASEGGHADFAPQTEMDIALLRYLQQRYGHVSWERVVSGMGLVNIHEFLHAHYGTEPPRWLVDEMAKEDKAAAISKGAQSGQCEICSETLDMFARLYGAEAGNQALKIMATGGVYIGGGIAPKILDNLREPAFMQGFCGKGRMQSLMQSMPVKVILNDRTALYGPAVYAATLLNQSDKSM